MSVRTAWHQDKADIIGLLQRMHDEVGWFPLSETRMIDSIDELLNHGMVLLLEDDGGVIGSAGLLAAHLWYSEAVILQDRWLYIHDRHRSKAGFEELLKACQQYARHVNLPLILGVWTINGSKKKERLFGGYMEQLCRGYQFVPVGGQFMSRGS